MIGVGLLTAIGSVGLDMAASLPVSHPDAQPGVSLKTPFDAHMTENVGPMLDSLLQKLPSEDSRQTGMAAKDFVAEMGRQYRDETVQPAGDAIVGFAEEQTGQELNLPPVGRRLPFHLALGGVIGALSSLVGGRKKRKDEEEKPREKKKERGGESKTKENLTEFGKTAIEAAGKVVKAGVQVVHHPVKASWGVIGAGTAVEFGAGVLPWQQVQEVAGAVIDPLVGLGFGVVLANQFINKEKRKDALSEKNLPTTVGSAAAFAWGVFGGPYALAAFGLGWAATKGYFMYRNWQASGQPPGQAQD
ncbi:MAG: hypothetical protein ABH834_04190 [Candidatus Altiarchaeota archaeon]